MKKTVPVNFDSIKRLKPEIEFSDPHRDSVIVELRENTKQTGKNLFLNLFRLFRLFPLVPYSLFRTFTYSKKKQGRRDMYRRLVIITMISLALLAALYAQRFQAQSQYPVMDKVAQKVIDKYQKSSCEDLKHQKSEAASGQDAEVKQKVVEAMRKDPQMRQEFINMVAAPIANKMFECGMIP
jgi:hypothetical protein